MGRQNYVIKKRNFHCNVFSFLPKRCCNFLAALVIALGSSLYYTGSQLKKSQKAAMCSCLKQGLNKYVVQGTE